jgi:alkanesulfonate monooxygenase SsuD/methylene tetrahydromethanopterin reductase-like flavin-dependent oxidoreductase (luciferase family)
MVVAEDHVADVGRIDAQLCQRRKDPLAASDHAGIHDDDSALIADQYNGAGDPLSGIPSTQDIQAGGHTPILSPPFAPRPRREAAVTGGAGDSNALVGAPQTVAQAILDYCELGVDIISMRGISMRGHDPRDGRAATRSRSWPLRRHPAICP